MKKNEEAILNFYVGTAAAAVAVDVAYHLFDRPEAVAGFEVASAFAHTPQERSDLWAH